MDGIVYGAVASLGFATLENVLYTAQGGLGVAIARAITAVPAHAFMGAIMGYYVGRARFPKGGGRGSLSPMALLGPIVLHGLYDFPLLTIEALQEAAGGQMTDQQALQVLPLLLVAIGALLALTIWALRLTSLLRSEQLALQASGGALGPATPLPGSPESAGYGASAPRPQGSYAVGCVLLVLGGLGASVGGFMLLGLVVAGASGELAEHGLAVVLATGLIAGVLPALVGLVLFVLGIRKLPRRSRR